VTTFLIVRHAESTWNAEGRWQGHADPPLSDHGAAQAVSAAQRLQSEAPFDLVVASDLTRAWTTAALLVGATMGEYPGQAGSDGHRIPSDGGEGVIVDPGLREIDVGEWSGLTRPEIEARWPGALALHASGLLARTPGGESRQEFDARVAAAVRSLLALATGGHAARGLVVAHGGVVKSIARAAGLDEPRTSNLSGYRASLVGEELQLEAPVHLIEELQPGSISPPP
jgi:probable phosphoglycerate mutase